MPTYAVRARRLAGVVPALMWALTLGVTVAPADTNESVVRPLQQAAITGGNTHACAVAADGRVRCWGTDSSGELGNGPVNNGVNAVPAAPVALGQSARAVTAGGSFTCALLVDAAVRCWGTDSQGRLGDGPASTVDSSVPSTVVALGQGARAITAGTGFACALLEDRRVRCWGFNSYGNLGTGVASPMSDAPAAAVALGQGALAVSSGGQHTCALLVDGTVRCWGYDSDGQLGDGGTTSFVNASPAPAVALGQPARAISSGVSSTCALLADATIRCWGSDGSGQLGDGGTTASVNAAPVGNVGLTQGARSIAVDGASACALLVDDTVRCWGNDQQGQLGDGGSTLAVNASPGGTVALGQSARAVTAASLANCALLADSTVRCWGYDSDGELGDGGTTAMVNSTPAAVVGMPSLASADSADLALSAAASVPAATVGDQITITLTLTNTGVDGTGATVAGPLGAGLALVSAATTLGSYSAATGLWRAGSLPAGGTATAVLVARVVSPGTLSTTAEVVDATAQDPDSVPANDVAAEDDRATATLTAVAAPVAPLGALPPAPAPAPAPAAKVKADRLTTRLKPARDTTAPFAFAPTATLLITKVPLATGCNGIVTFTATAGGRTVLTQRAPLRLRSGVCSATTKTKLRKRPGRARKLLFVAAFGGNALLLPAKGAAASARIT